MSSLNDIGIIGMGTMGKALAFNIASKGYATAIFNRTTSKMTNAASEAAAEGLPITGYDTIKGFIESLTLPRKIITIITAGPSTDAIVSEIRGLLEPGDLIVDGANEHHMVTKTRMLDLQSSKILYLGLGISGGESGARYGPALMAGGSVDAWYLLKPILEDIAAEGPKGHCAQYIGLLGAGHFVKMVHNGIEYAIMQQISEVYNLFKNLLSMETSEIGTAFDRLNIGVNRSYLIDITIKILKATHPEETTVFLLDDVLDVAGAKGTGKWTIMEATKLDVPCPSIWAAVDARNLSTRKTDRVNNATVYQPILQKKVSNVSVSFDMIQEVLYASTLIAFLQGLELIRKASATYGYEISLLNTVSAWQNGCILRGDILENLLRLVVSETESYMSDKWVKSVLSAGLASWSTVCSAAYGAHIPVPSISSSLNYVLLLLESDSPISLIQAQRDHFGAHTFSLKSNPTRTVHANWESSSWQ